MWTTDIFLQNLARFSALKGQDWDGPMAVLWLFNTTKLVVIIVNMIMSGKT